MEHATSALGLPGRDYQGEVRQQKIDLNHSTTSGISRAGTALKTLIVCIIQVQQTTTIVSRTTRQFFKLELRMRLANHMILARHRAGPLG